MRKRVLGHWPWWGTVPYRGNVRLRTRSERRLALASHAAAAEMAGSCGRVQTKGPVPPMERDQP